MKTIRLKNDHYRKARGGYSRFFKIFCSECSKLVFLYQKDGLGILKRLYLDRIFPLQHNRPWGKQLICPYCKTILGIRMIYKKEKRIAYRLFVGAVTKK